MVFNFFWNVILKAFNAFFFYVNIFTLFFPLLTWLLACLAGWSQAKVTFLFSQFLSLSHLFPTPAAACNRQIWLFLLSRFSVHQSYRPFSKSSPACLLACSSAFSVKKVRLFPFKQFQDKSPFFFQCPPPPFTNKSVRRPEREIYFFFHF